MDDTDEHREAVRKWWYANGTDLHEMQKEAKTWPRYTLHTMPTEDVAAV